MSRHFRVALNCCPSEEEKVWRLEGQSLQSSDGEESYSFDAILRESGGGEELYSRVVSPLVFSALNGGHDLFVVAYGLPGTGKSHAVFGPPAQMSRLRREARGIVARLGQQIFDIVSGDRVCRVSASFFHVFEDGRVTDLFDSRRRRLEVVEDSSDTCSYSIPSIAVHQVSSSLELARLTERANLMRNASGGRRDHQPTPQPQSHKSHCSHAFVRLLLERVVDGEKKGEERVMKTQITVVDLAGHSIEQVQANQPSPDGGITTLHQIMTTLPCQGITATAGLFSNSSLTKLLRPCLGGSSETLLLGTLSLSESSREKTKRCLKVLHEAMEIKNYCRHSVTPVSGSDLGRTLEKIADMKKEVCGKVGVSEQPQSWRTGREQDGEYVEINGQRFSQLSSSCAHLLQSLDKLEAQLLYKGVSCKKQQNPLPPGGKPTGTPAAKPPTLARPFLPKPRQLPKPMSPPSVATSTPKNSITHSSSSSLEESSSSDEECSQPSTTLSGPPPPLLRDIPHVIPNSTFIPPRPQPRSVPFRPSSGHSHPHSLASSSQVSSVVSEAVTSSHLIQRPSSPTGSSHCSSIHNVPTSPQSPTPHSTSSHLPRVPISPRGSGVPPLPPPTPVKQLAPLPRPVVPHILSPPRPLLPVSVVRPRPPLPAAAVNHGATPILTSTPKKLDQLSVPAAGLPLSALPPIPPSPSQPSTPGSLTPNAGSPAPSPFPSPVPPHRPPIIPPSHLTPLTSPPAPPLPIAGGNLSTSSSSITLSDSDDLSQEARDTFDPVMRSRALSMHRNSLPYNGVPVTYQTPQEEAPPYEDVDRSLERGQVGGEERGGGGRMNMSEYTSREEIHMAAMEGVKSSQLKKLAIQYGVDYRDHGGRTPLMYAVLGNQPRMCDALLSLGAKVNTQDSTGLTPLLWATFQAKPQCMKILLKHGADICMRDSEGRSVFHWAVKTPNINCLKALQKQASPTIINTADKEGLTPLHWAVLCNQPSHTHLLLTSAGADVTIQDNEGRTALTHAVLNTSSACIKAILEVNEGAVNHRDEKGRTTLHYACAEGSTDCVRTLVAARSCDLHSRDNRGTTPLHWAAAANQPSVLQLLLRRGVDRSVKDSDGLTAVEHAEMRGHSECARILHNYGLRRPSSALSVASQVSVHAPQPPSLDQHGHIALSLPHRRFSLSHSSLPRPPADGQAQPDDSLSDHTHGMEPQSHTQTLESGGDGGRRRRWREVLCGCNRRRNAIMPAPT